MRLIRDLRKEGNLEIGTTVTMQPPDWLASKALQNTGQTLYYIILYYIYISQAHQYGHCENSPRDNAVNASHLDFQISNAHF